MLAAILQTGGYKTGLYTSPHLKDFRERIRIDGEMVREEFVISFTEKLKPLIEELKPSFFEVTVAMAFEWFAQQKVEIAVIETGLGGRLDSTNIVTPEISVITNIGFDHMDLLGKTIPEIASEKAGIIKPGVPVVIGEVTDESLPVFEQVAIANNAPVFIAAKKRWVNNWQWKGHEFIVETGQQDKTDHTTIHLDLTGIYQRKNLLTVLETSSQLQSMGWNTGEAIVKTALSRVKKLTGLHGRWEIIYSNPTVILDVAHNIDGINQLMQQIEVTPHNNLHIVLGLVKDKDIESILSAFPKTAKFYFTKAQIPRALPEGELAEKASITGIQGDSFPEVNLAVESAIQRAQEDDLVIVCGSVYLVAEVNKLSPSFSKA